jgi:hypothetical protein
MKAIIFILLMNYFICYQMVHFKSFSLSSSESNFTTNYLDISEYDQNDEMHIVIIVKKGEIDKIIHYGFSDQTSITSNLLSYTADTTSSESFYTKGGKTANPHKSSTIPAMKYYYDIKKVENAKYLLIQCTGFTGSSIEYSLIPFSSITFYIIFGVIAFVCLAALITYIIWKIIKEKNSDNIIIQKNTDLAPITPQDNQPTYNNY